MSTIKTVLAGVAAAAVGYGAYKGVKFLVENNESSNSDYGDEVYSIIEKARAEAEADLAGQQLEDPILGPTIIDSNVAPML